MRASSSVGWGFLYPRNHDGRATFCQPIEFHPFVEKRGRGQLIADLLL